MPARQEPKAFAAHFRAASTMEWPELWAAWAESATLSDLEALQSQRRENPSWLGDDGQSVLTALAEEELALRSEKLPGSRHGAAALAEHDPAKAWQAVQQAHASMVTAATLRMLAIRDPKAALEKWKTLGPERGPDWTGENDVIHSPLGSIFAAWTRRDPSAAMKAAAELPANDRRIAQAEIALTLAYHDGPAALRYIFEHGIAAHCRMDAIYRSAFSQSQAASRATAALLQEHPDLKTNSRAYLGPWYRTDPESARAWVLSMSKNGAVSYTLASLDPHTALQLLAAAPLQQSDASRLAAMYEHAPDKVKALAEQRGIWADVEARFRKLSGDPDPTARLKEMLERIKQSGPDQVLTESPEDIKRMDSWLDCARRYLPEAVAVLESVTIPAPRPGTSPYDDRSPVPPAEFAYDPGATARRLQENPVSDWDAWHAVTNWAPYDFRAAQAWVDSLPKGTARNRAETALLNYNTTLSGEELVERLIAADPRDFLPDGKYAPGLSEVGEIWEAGLSRVAQSGGDWRRLYARIPAAYREDGVTRTGLDMIKERLELEEAVLRELR
jgi:hypothetical protein